MSSQKTATVRSIYGESDTAVLGTESEPTRLPGPVNETSRTGTADRHLVLLVDDERSVLRALKRAFADEQFDVLTAESGPEALDIAGRRAPTVVISDFRMPGMSGTELLAQMKGRWPQTILILLTGAADIEQVNRAIDSGVLYKFLTKPWNDTDLCVTVRLAIAQYDLLKENAQLKKLSLRQQRELTKLHRFSGSSDTTLSQLLITNGLILPAQVLMVEQYSQESHISVIRALIDMGMIEEPALLRVIQDESRIEMIVLENQHLDCELSALLPREICEAECMVPVRVDGDEVVLAVANPLDLPSIDYVRFSSGNAFPVRLAAAGQIERAIRHIYGDESMEEGTGALEFTTERDDIDVRLETADLQTPEALLAGSATPSAVQMVNTIIAEAVRTGASDIHIEPHTEIMAVRYRIDGLLQERMRVPVKQHLTTVSRLKILARMDISVRRIPQDGRISVRIDDRLVDIRVSTMPTIYGEKVVCRLLDRSVSVRTVDELGIRDDSLRRLRTLINVPQGVIIATGPTGSGKTTTLYSLLQERISSIQNFVTIEDPVEYFMNEAAQVHVQNKAGLTFASTLRATLRQDPDVILVGEIRDGETAQAAFQAAMTGHLVFTTLHTNSTVGTISRLLHLGVEPYLVASAVQGIIAQRLVRAVCPHCREDREANTDLIRGLGLEIDCLPDRLAYGAGCEICHGTGYDGRVGLYEVFHMNPEFRSMIITTYDETRLAAVASRMGIESLIEDGRKKVRDGMTTLEELIRVLGPSIDHQYNCHDCGAALEPKFSICPFCGSVQRLKCHRCDALLEIEWKVCPYCGETSTARTGRQQQS